MAKTLKSIWKAPESYVGAGAGIALAVVLSIVPGVLPIFVGLAAVAGTLGTASVVSLFKRPTNDNGELKLSPISDDVFENLPNQLSSSLKEKLKELEHLERIYSKVNPDLANRINDVCTNGQEMFARVKSKLDNNTGRIAAVNYLDIFSKLNKALGEKYYLDISKNPQFWNNPQERLSAVRAALDATAKQLIENIKQINASQDIEYSVAIEALIRADANALQTAYATPSGN